jgi:RimJ/RimL family protein N-acetyltransferase
MKLGLRKIEKQDKPYFAKWWRDKDLIRLTSGNMKRISARQLGEYFDFVYKEDFGFIITLDKRPIGHISLSKRKDGWRETQIIIGNKKQWGRGFGTKAIKNLLAIGRKNGIKKIYLNVRPENIRAMRTYLGCGFVPKGLIYQPQNKNMPLLVRMELWI